VVLFEGYIFLKILNTNYLIANGTVLPTLKRYQGNRVFFGESSRTRVAGWRVVGGKWRITVARI
jgi:hypothetical protein